MEHFTHQRQVSIEARFCQKAGLPFSPRQRRPVRTVLVLAAVLACLLSLTVFAASLFSPLSGDELSLSAQYQGAGVVAVTVENGSDKVLTFQPQLKLLRWSTAQEVEPLSDGTVQFENLRFAPHSSGVMTVDLSGAYDVTALEEPLPGDHYYFLLTNQDFVFGQDWICSVWFSDGDEGSEPPPPAETSGPDQALTAQAEVLLRPFLENPATDPDTRRQQAQDYWAACQEVMTAAEGRVVSSVSPMMAFSKEDPTVVFDNTIPAGEQFQRLTFQTWTLWDSFGIPVGGYAAEHALEISGLVPQYQGQTDGGAAVPLCYFMFYDRADAEDPEALALIRGRLLTFSQLEDAKVWEDGQYVCYDVTDLFYTDLSQHVESILSQYTDVCMDDQAAARLEAIAAYYRDREVVRDGFTDLSSR